MASLPSAPDCWRRASPAAGGEGSQRRAARERTQLSRRRVADPLAIATATVLLSLGSAGPVGAAGFADDDVYGVTFPFVLEDQVFTVPAPGVLANDGPAPGGGLCIVGPPATSSQGGTVSLSADGSFTYTSPPDFAGPDTFTYEAGSIMAGGACVSSGTDTAVAHLTVLQVNDAPTVTAVGDCADGLTVPEDAGGYLGEDLCVAMDPGPANEASQEPSAWLVAVAGTVGFADGPTITDEGFLKFRPLADDFGTATLTIRGRDNGGTANGGADTSQPIEVTITVSPVADAPNATADSFGALKDRTLDIAAPGVLANDSDADGDPLTAVLVTAPVHGTLTLAANGSFSYAPAAGYVGPDAFSYRASDGSRTSATRVVSLNVSAVPLPSPTPVLTEPPASLAPTSEPTIEVTPEPTLEPSPSPGAGGSPAATTVAATLGPGTTPAPEPTAQSGGISLPLLLAVVLVGMLLIFGGAYLVPRWLDGRRGFADDID